MKEPRFFCIEAAGYKGCVCAVYYSKARGYKMSGEEKGQPERVVKQHPSVVVDYNKYMRRVDTK